MKRLVAKFDDRRKDIFNNWLRNNNRVEVENRDNELILENICSDSVVVKKNPNNKTLKQGRKAKLESGFDVLIEGRLFTVEPEEE